MSILDDAIREHLELKRAHGADEAELKRLEDEAFGPAERPNQLAQQVDPFAEAPTEFLSTPQDAPEATPTDPPTGGRQLPNVADLQEPPPPRPVAPEENAEDADTEGPGDEADQGPSDQADSGPSDQAEEAEGPSEEEHPAMEHRTIAQPAPEDRPAPPSDELQPDPEAPSADAPSAAERHAAAEQPTELFDVEGQFEDTAESAGPVDPLADIEDSGEEVEVSSPADDDPEDEFDEFFSEQRLSDELNQALEAPLPDEPEDSAESDLPQESGEHDVSDHPRDDADAEGAEEYQPHEPGHADALEDTPQFLEESPEDDDAWFEQRPPKDFDFGD